jgi:4-hydroxyproline epimerase
MAALERRIRVIDSHTGGEPTRTVIAGGPDLGGGSLTARRERFRTEHDGFRRAVILEPRGSDVLVGALLVEPHEPDCVAGVIFFNNVACLGMCGHGAIGVIVTLARLGRITAGVHRLDTPAGVVTATLHDDGSVSIRNVPARRFRSRVPLDVDGLGRIHGDIAWGGNWFFLVSDHGLTVDPANLGPLTAASNAIRSALSRHRITGAGGAEIDHVELFGPALGEGDSRNFVLCPGSAWDRSPCGTGTSAKLACLAADGKLAAGARWRQESVIGSVFEAEYALIPTSSEGGGQTLADDTWDGPAIIPTIRGTAWISAEADLIIRSDDPFAEGITPS